MNRMCKNSFKEISRDIVALGSPVFFILVLARVFLLDKEYYFSQFAIAGVLFMLLFFIFKANVYSGLGIIILIFTNLYYNDLRFGIFSGTAYILALVSLNYLKHDKKEIFLGLLMGLISTGISYLVVRILFF